ncbi:MAG: hypothetical protein NTW19_23155 [Planctomycetota bacterium]|nr:hypothetical protein [Planctomycetota bacterium]
MPESRPPTPGSGARIEGSGWPDSEVRCGYLRALLTFTLLWGCALTGFIALVNPYGISPGSPTIARFNSFKPLRSNIDRLIKPIEVWRDQPRTVFLGSSRIHQAINPAMLDGTRFAPAYNGAVPACTVALNEKYINQYIELDPNLRYVVVELFMLQFWGHYYDDYSVNQGIAQTPKTWRSMLQDGVTLSVGSSALWDSVRTVAFNVAPGDFPAGGYIHPRGYWMWMGSRAGPRDGTGWGKGNVNYFLNEKDQYARDYSLRPDPFAALDRMIANCRKHGVEVYFIITPENPFHGYTFLSTGHWPMVMEWYRRLSHYPNVFSFAEYNPMLTEPISTNMQYWYDGGHFSRKFGDAMLKAFVGERGAAIPANTMVPLTEDNVESVLADRKRNLDTWIGQNQPFVQAFERAKAASGIGKWDGPH